MGTCWGQERKLSPQEAKLHLEWMDAWHIDAGRVPDVSSYKKGKDDKEGESSTLFHELTETRQAALQLHAKRMWLLKQEFAQLIGQEMSRKPTDNILNVAKTAASDRHNSVMFRLKEHDLTTLAKRHGLQNADIGDFAAAFLEYFGVTFISWVRKHWLQNNSAITLNARYKQSMYYTCTGEYQYVQIVLELEW